MKELHLWAAFDLDGSFEIQRKLFDPDRCLDSILVLDYNYTPWPRDNGNLLWS